MGKRVVVLWCGLIFSGCCFASDNQGKALELTDSKQAGAESVYSELRGVEEGVSFIDSQPKAEKAHMCASCSLNKYSSCCGECWIPALLLSLDKLILLGIF